MKAIKCIECGVGVRGCDILADAERTCCSCLWAGGGIDKDEMCDACAKRVYQLEF